jgi:lipoprotein signal peptidase
MIHALPRWPGLFPYIFNVADSLLCVGVGLMIIHSLFYRADLPHKDTQAAREAVEPS